MQKGLRQFMLMSSSLLYYHWDVVSQTNTSALSLISHTKCITSISTSFCVIIFWGNFDIGISCQSLRKCLVAASFLIRFHQMNSPEKVTKMMTQKMLTVLSNEYLSHVYREITRIVTDFISHFVLFDSIRWLFIEECTWFFF